MFEMTKLKADYNILKYIGHVDNVINGIIPDNLKDKRFLASDYKYGFELGSPQSIYNLGECIMLNGMIYSSRTDISRKDRNALMWGPEFITSGIFIIPEQSFVNYEIKYFSFSNEKTLAQIYQLIFNEVNLPFALVGCIELSRLRAKSITRPPISKENIFDKAENYYQEEDYIDNDVNVAIMGVVSNPKDSKLKKINKKLSSVLYYNPFSLKNTLLSHTHALLLNKSMIDLQKVGPKEAVEVLHLMDESEVRYANLKVYVIKDLKEIVV